jgi:ferredoxin
MMKVTIDQELCMGDGLCENIAPDIFTVLEDGVVYVIDRADGDRDPRLAATVPSEFEKAVVDAAEQCPGECIFIDRT